MKSPATKIWLSVLLVGVGAYGAYSGVRIYRMRNEATRDIRPEAPLPTLQEITLTDANGKPFQFDQMQGKIWVANVLYTSCPNDCSKITTRVKSLHEAYPNVHFVSISCDPDRDTPAQMKIWAGVYGEESDRWHFVTGKMSDIAAVGKHLFGEKIKRAIHSPYVVIHDRVGLPSGLISLMTDMEKIHEALDQLAQAQMANSPQSNTGPRPPEPPVENEAPHSGHANGTTER